MGPAGPVLPSQPANASSPNRHMAVSPVRFLSDILRRVITLLSFACGYEPVITPVALLATPPHAYADSADVRCKSYQVGTECEYGAREARYLAASHFGTRRPLASTCTYLSVRKRVSKGAATASTDVAPVTRNRRPNQGRFSTWVYALLRRREYHFGARFRRDSYVQHAILRAFPRGR